MISTIRQVGIIPFFAGALPGWSVEEWTAPECWFTDEEEGGTLGPWDWKIDAVREGDIAYGKFIGGKAAFATADVYSHLMNWRRGLPRYRMALGETYSVKTTSDRLMKLVSPLVLTAIKDAGALEGKEIRSVCSARLTPDDVAPLGERYTELLLPTMRKNVLDSVIQFLQMGTWTIIGDFRRGYRGPALTYSGWQASSHTTPDELFFSNSSVKEEPWWVQHIVGSKGPSYPVNETPEQSMDWLVAHVRSHIGGDEFLIRKILQ